MAEEILARPIAVPAVVGTPDAPIEDRIADRWPGTPIPSRCGSILSHAASVRHAGTASRAVIDTVRRHRAGEAMVGLIDRARGY